MRCCSDVLHRKLNPVFHVCIWRPFAARVYMRWRLDSVAVLHHFTVRHSIFLTVVVVVLQQVNIPEDNSLEYCGTTLSDQVTRLQRSNENKNKSIDSESKKTKKKKIHVTE